MSELTIKDKVEETFVFGEHNFESVGDAPFNVLKCKHCDRFASHHLNYAVKESIMQLIDSAITEARLQEINLFREAMINHSTPMIYAPNRIKELKSNTTKQENIKGE